MKRSSLAAVSSVLTALLLSACTGPGTGSVSTAGPSGAAGKTVWYADVVDSNPTSVAIAQGMNAVFAQNGITMTRSLAVDTTTGQLDLGAQSQALTRAIQSKPAAIAYFMLDPSASRPQVEQALSAGIPVFAVLGKPSFPVSAYIALFDEQEGSAAAAYLAAHLHQGDQVAVIDGPNTQNVNAEVAGAVRTLKKAGMDVVGDVDQQRNLTDDASGGKAVMQGILQQYPDVEGVLAYNDDSALGAIAAAKQAGKKILFTSRNGSVDAIQAIKAGELLGTCDIQPVQVGRRVAEAMVEQITGRKTYTGSERIASPSAATCMVTAGNVGSWRSPQQLVHYTKMHAG